jgi:hypothetical protein
MVKNDPTKLSRWEILGTWLNVWTPPRDAHVPPIPWRKVGLYATATAIVLAVGLAIAIPRIDARKTTVAAQQHEELSKRQAARRHRIRVEQRPRQGEATGARSRSAVLTTVEAAIGADARERFNPRSRAATCEPAARQAETADRVAYDCLSAVRDIVGAGEQEGAHGTLGIPFRAIIDFTDRSYAFCKVNPVPGEQVVPDPRKIIALPAACRL